MLQLIANFHYNNKEGHIYKRNGLMYYSHILLHKNVENSKFLMPIDPKISLSDFLLTL